MTEACFYEKVVEFESRRENSYTGTYVATSHTASPWSPEHQHAGPPAALLVHAIEQLTVPNQRALTNQMAFDILAPIPMGAVAVTSRIIKSGRLASLVEAELSIPGSEHVIMRLSAWRTRRTDVPVSDRLGAYKAAPKEGATAMRPEHWGAGFADAMEWRLVKGTMGAGRATVWARPRVAFIDEERATGVQMLLLLADSASGVSALADPRHLLFVNTDLSVHVVREPVGEWVWMRAQSFIDPDGIGLGNSRLGDVRGSLGFGNQSLFVAKQSEVEV